MAGLMITPDTSTLHIAFTFGIPVLALYHKLIPNNKINIERK